MCELSTKEPFEKLDTIDFRKLAWNTELANNVNSLENLKQYFSLTEEEEHSMQEVLDNHPMNIPRYYLSLINSDDIHDSIRKLAIPTAKELVVAGQMGETTGDPYGDDKHNKGNGILHKYPYSALVVTTEYCSMYCRHCFRKRLVGLPNDKTVENFQNAAKYIAEHKEITNVIISGGDPMMLPTKVIAKMLEALKDIDHVNYVRIGTRTPVVYPLRYFDDELIEVLRNFNKQKTLYIPTHFNHANEITDLSKEAVMRIRNAGITVNNQAVFLKGVNDTVQDLEDLMNGLTRIGVNPYYLYQCMPVSRVRHHFQVPLKHGVDIVSKAKRSLDGYAKRFKFIMGHDIGKIEICGRKDDILVMNQIHARPEHPEEASRILMGHLTENAGWLEDLDLIQ
ncbi:MAG: KamA family radical SAM protein [Proteobacteria bacterium]|nr:KamA family radical SAM protein [Pseudomonadota bacterium]MBU1418606.1 KamA family radical SAM protein [Pseudomonadota bacterium]MBU1454184.1 KamA family radical SAM protein [Pseudomonadota bacterium]